jgi:RNA polymerase sigma-32 factor
MRILGQNLARRPHWHIAQMYDDSAKTPLSAIIAKTSLLTKERERQLVQRSSSGCRKSRETLIMSFMPLVRSIARQMVRGGESVDDLVSEGTKGLIDAVDDVDPERNNRFSSYAKFNIVAAIQTHLTTTKSLVMIKESPQNKRILFFSTNETKKAGFSTVEGLTSGQALTVAQALRVPPMKLEMMDVVIRGEAQVDLEQVSDKDLTALNPLLECPDQEATASDAQIETRCSSAINAIMDHLDAREQDILRNRMLSENEILEVMAARYNVSRERIRQIEERLLHKMRFWIAQADPGLVEALLDGRSDADVLADMDPRWTPNSERDGRGRMMRSRQTVRTETEADVVEPKNKPVHRRPDPEAVVEEPIRVFFEDGMWSMTTRHLR